MAEKDDGNVKRAEGNRDGGNPRRLVILAEGAFSTLESKTASCIIRYRADEVVAVIDSGKAGLTAQAVLGFGGDIPVVSCLSEGLAFSPDTLLIGIAPRGGGLPETWRPVIISALSSGLDIISGLHFFLSDDAELASLAREKGLELIDLRKVPSDIGICTCMAGDAEGDVILTVGTDCNVGKMTASMELVSGARRRGIDAIMVATGQTGIYLTDRGLAIDRCVADFISGAVERLVIEADAPGRWLVTEGQGSLTHPAYSGVALAVLHGAMPDCMVLCHQPNRTRMSGYDLDLPPLPEVIKLHETLAGYVKPSKVVAVALNCFELDDNTAIRARAEVEDKTGLPAADPIRHGPGRLVEALEKYLSERSGR